MTTLKNILFCSLFIVVLVLFTFSCATSNEIIYDNSNVNLPSYVDSPIDDTGGSIKVTKSKREKDTFFNLSIYTPHSGFVVKNGDIIISETLNEILLPVGNYQLEIIHQDYINEIISVEIVSLSDLVKVEVHPTLSKKAQIRVLEFKRRKLRQELDQVKNSGVIGKTLRYVGIVTSFVGIANYAGNSYVGNEINNNITYTSASLGLGGALMAIGGHLSIPGTGRIEKEILDISSQIEELERKLNDAE